MRTKLFLLMIFLGTLSGFSQSTVSITEDELRVITKMTEDLRYTKVELEVADSILLHQRQIILLKDQEINLKTQESVRRQTKTGIISGIAGVLVGLIFGAFL